MATQNAALLQIYQILCDQQDALSAEIQQPTTTPLLATSISGEIQEIAHRIILVQNLIFISNSAQLSALVANIKTASNDLTMAIGQIQKVTDFLNSVSGFLADVDQAIDLAKTLAAGAGKA